MQQETTKSSSALTEQDINFLIFVLGFYTGRAIKELPADEAEKIHRQCQDLWPKLTDLLYQNKTAVGCQQQCPVTGIG